MTFKTGRQYSIGGGSTLTFLGEQNFSDDIFGPLPRPFREGGELYFLAHLAVEPVDTIRIYEKVLLQELRTHEYVCTYEPRIASLHWSGGREGQILIFRWCFDGQITNVESYCFALAHKLQRCWRMVEISEFTPNNGKIGRRGEYPIHPSDILHKEYELAELKPGPQYIASRALIDVAIKNRNCWLPIAPLEMSPEICKGLLGLELQGYVCREKNGTYTFSQHFVVDYWKLSIGERDDHSFDGARFSR